MAWKLFCKIKLNMSYFYDVHCSSSFYNNVMLVRAVVIVYATLYIVSFKNSVSFQNYVMHYLTDVIHACLILTSFIVSFYIYLHQNIEYLEILCPVCRLNIPVELFYLYTHWWWLYSTHIYGTPFGAMNKLVKPYSIKINDQILIYSIR